MPEGLNAEIAGLGVQSAEVKHGAIGRDVKRKDKVIGAAAGGSNGGDVESS